MKDRNGNTIVKPFSFVDKKTRYKDRLLPTNLTASGHMRTQSWNTVTKPLRQQGADSQEYMHSNSMLMVDHALSSPASFH